MNRWMLPLLFLLLPFLTGGNVLISQGPGCTGTTLPTIRNVGTVAAGIGAVSPGLPSGNTAGDLLIMACETGDQAITVSGWNEVPGSPSVDSGATRLTLFFKVAVGSDATTTSDSGNHQLCRIVGITTATYCSSPFGEYNENTQTSGTGVSVSGVTTTLNNALVLSYSAGALPDADSTTEFSGEANTDLGSVTERIDNATSAGTGGTGGGSLGMWSGTKVTAGTVGATTATAVTTSTRANAMVVINGGS